MEMIMSTERYDFISEQDKAFLVSFSEALAALGYDFDREIGPGFCWGRYMICLIANE